MSRTKRISKSKFIEVRENSCKPGCGVCGKDRQTRKQIKHKLREEGKKEITGQVEDD